MQAIGCRLIPGTAEDIGVAKVNQVRFNLYDFTGGHREAAGGGDGAGAWGFGRNLSLVFTGTQSLSAGGRHFIETILCSTLIRVFVFRDF